MAGTRKQHDLRGVDKSSQEYWEEVLGRSGLSMAKGSSTHLVYVGDTKDLDYIEGRIQTDTGRDMPKPIAP